MTRLSSSSVSPGPWSARDSPYRGDLGGVEACAVILVANDQRVLVAASGGISTLLGFEPHEIVGRRVDEIAAPEAAEATDEQWAALRGLAVPPTSLPCAT